MPTNAGAAVAHAGFLRLTQLHQPARNFSQSCTPMWWRCRDVEEGPSFPATAPVPARSAGALPDPGTQPGVRGGSLTLLLPLCLQKIGFLLLLMEVCTYRTCRRKMPCPPTGVSPSTSTAGRRGRATAPGSPSQVSPCGCQRGRGAAPCPGGGPAMPGRGSSPARECPTLPGARSSPRCHPAQRALASPPRVPAARGHPGAGRGSRGGCAGGWRCPGRAPRPAAPRAGRGGGSAARHPEREATGRAAMRCDSPRCEQPDAM